MCVSGVCAGVRVWCGWTHKAICVSSVCVCEWCVCRCEGLVWMDSQGNMCEGLVWVVGVCVCEWCGWTHKAICAHVCSSAC